MGFFREINIFHAVFGAVLIKGLFFLLCFHSHFPPSMFILDFSDKILEDR